MTPDESYTDIHYGEELRPYTQYPILLCEHLADAYFKARQGKLLDVCCGRGEHVEIFQNLGFEAYGVDKEGVGKKKGLNVRVADVDKDDLPFDDEFFDFVMIKSAVEHIRNIYHMMDNVRRVLKPGGKLVITTCDWKTCYKVFYDDADHKSPFTQWSLQDLLLRYGFKNANVEYFYHLPFTWKGKPFQAMARLVAFLFPFDFPQTVRLTPLIKLIKFSREKQILGYGEK